jgi:hypothetical protein
MWSQIIPHTLNLLDETAREKVCSIDPSGHSAFGISQQFEGS